MMLARITEFATYSPTVTVRLLKRATNEAAVKTQPSQSPASTIDQQD